MHSPKSLRTTLAAFAALAALGLAGCLTSGLSEEAQPQNQEEHFLVQIAEFKSLATEANLWIDGVLSAARLGDPVALAQVEAAERIGQILETGRQLIKAAELARSQGNLNQFIADGQIVQDLLIRLQAELATAGATS